MKKFKGKVESMTQLKNFSKDVDVIVFTKEQAEQFQDLMITPSCHIEYRYTDLFFRGKQIIVK